VIDFLASVQNPWPNTEQQLVLICKEIKPEMRYGANEFIKDGKICQWIIVVKKT